MHFESFGATQFGAFSARCEWKQIPGQLGHQWCVEGHGPDELVPYRSNDVSVAAEADFVLASSELDPALIFDTNTLAAQSDVGAQTYTFSTGGAALNGYFEAILTWLPANFPDPAFPMEVSIFYNVSSRKGTAFKLKSVNVMDVDVTPVAANLLKLTSRVLSSNGILVNFAAAVKHAAARVPGEMRVKISFKTDKEFVPGTVVQLTVLVFLRVSQMLARPIGSGRGLTEIWDL